MEEQMRQAEERRAAEEAAGRARSAKRTFVCGPGMGSGVAAGQGAKKPVRRIGL